MKNSKTFFPCVLCWKFLSLFVSQIWWHFAFFHKCVVLYFLSHSHSNFVPFPFLMVFFVQCGRPNFVYNLLKSTIQLSMKWSYFLLTEKILIEINGMKMILFSAKNLEADYEFFGQIFRLLSSKKNCISWDNFVCWLPWAGTSWTLRHYKRLFDSL